MIEDEIFLPIGAEVSLKVGIVDPLLDLLQVRTEIRIQTLIGILKIIATDRQMQMMAIMLRKCEQTIDPLGLILVVAIMRILDPQVDSGTIKEMGIGRMMELVATTGQLEPDVMFVGP